MAEKFLYPDLEREFIDESYSSSNYSCPQCLEPITNPICHSCLGVEVGKWLSLYPDIKKKMTPKLRAYLREVNNNTLNSVNCVACSKEKAALCPYCFTEGIFNMLRKNHIDKRVVMDFLSTFNFDLKHEGYINHAIEEGLY